MLLVLVPLLIVALLVTMVVVSYNGLVAQRQRTRNSWSQIDVQLKRRHDLVPNLVESVKGAMAHEHDTLEAVMRARQMAVDASSVAEQSRAESMLTSSLRSLFAVTENYPLLQANENVLRLQEELTSTENRIGFARQHYNDAVTLYNTRVESFPTNLLAQAFSFRMAEYFEIEDVREREAVAVRF